MLETHINRLNASSDLFKTYSKWTTAAKAAAAMELKAREQYNTDVILRYVVVPLENGRWSPFVYHIVQNVRYRHRGNCPK